MKLCVKNDGFQGALFESSARSFAIICVSGSEGGLFGAKQIARAFHREGISALALAYFNTRQTPRALCEIPVETVERAVLFLRRRGYERVGIYGFSKGAELALLAASLIPDLSLVIAASPACCVFEGFTPQKMPAGRSSWTWRGEPLPYVPMPGLDEACMQEKRKAHAFGFTEEYTRWLDQSASEETAIAAERANGAILLLSAKDDEMWPAERMANTVVSRLQQKNFPYPYHHAVYAPASHLLAPINLPFRFLFATERANPKACNASRRLAFQLAVSWVKEQARAR